MSGFSEHDEEPEENYFVSLTDLMTGVVFIFVILLCAFALHYQTEAKAAREAVTDAETQKARADRAATSAAKAEGDAREKGQKIDALGKLLGCDRAVMSRLHMLVAI